ncbi:MAG: DUF2225 domain-containing protein [Planctomycetes bacterium]|jgi:uncharacterized protein (DUF2225 family)|nr:DUF2225 domain-containing protein [Planctomycetota bacterium]
MPRFEDKRLTCPACDHAFDTRLVTGFQIGEKEADFCPRYLDGNPLPDFLHVCPECGFVGFEADYRSLPGHKKLDRVRTLLRGFHWQKGQNLGGAERYRRAALVAIYVGKRSAEIADLYLQATWCSRMEGEPDDEQRNARRKAVKYFELGLEAEEFSPDDLPVVHYLVGELCRRLGDSKKAARHFGRLDELPNVEPWLKQWRDRQQALMP